MLRSKDVIVKTKKPLIEGFFTATVEWLGTSAFAERHGVESNVWHWQEAYVKNGDWRGNNGTEATKTYLPSSQSSFGRYMMKPPLLAASRKVDVGVSVNERVEFVRQQHNLQNTDQLKSHDRTEQLLLPLHVPTIFDQICFWYFFLVHDISAFWRCERYHGTG